MNGSAVYYEWPKEGQPRQFQVLACIDDPNSCYSFDYFFVFQHVPSGRVFYGQDSGCSCPSPFENDHWNSPDDTSFTEITKVNLDDAIKALWDHYRDHSSLQDEKRTAETAIRDAVL